MHWEIPSGYLISGERIIVEPEELELVRIRQLSKTTCLLILSRMEREGGGVTDQNTLFVLQEREIGDLSFCHKKINGTHCYFLECGGATKGMTGCMLLCAVVGQGIDRPPSGQLLWPLTTSVIRFCFV